MKTVTSDSWLGFDKDNSPIQIEHINLMNWARKNDKELTVGWSHRFERDGERLVRGDHVKEAIKAGWADLAKSLANHLGSCPGLQVEDDVFSGCNGTGGDCPTCGN